MGTRVLLLTQWFDPEPTFKGLVFARELVSLGFDVEVLTGFPNYPGGTLYQGYKLKFIQREVIDGVRITRVPLYPSHDGSTLRRILNYASFGVSSLFYGLLMRKRPHLIYAYHPPLTVGISAAIIGFFRRIPIVCDIQDLWPDSLRATGMLTNERALSFVGLVCRQVYRSADRIVVLSPGFKKCLEDRGVPSGKLSVIYNWSAESELKNNAAELEGERRPFPNDGKFRVLFAGNMGTAQALDSVLKAAALVGLATSDVAFVFIGSGIHAESLRSQAESEGIRNVIFLPPVPMHAIGRFLEAADALLVHLRKDPLFTITIPSKTQAYMAAGKPILMAVDGDSAELVENAACGVLARSEDPESIASAVMELAEMSDLNRSQLGANGRRFYEDQLCVRVGVKRFATVFREVLSVNRVNTQRSD